MNIEQQQRLYDALKRIATSFTTGELRRRAPKQYGLSAEEAIEYAHDNLRAEAREALRGLKRPKAD